MPGTKPLTNVYSNFKCGRYEKGYKSKTPGVIGVLIGFGSFGILWFSVDLDT